MERLWWRKDEGWGWAEGGRRGGGVVEISTTVAGKRGRGEVLVADVLDKVKGCVVTD